MASTGAGADAGAAGGLSAQAQTPPSIPQINAAAARPIWHLDARALAKSGLDLQTRAHLVSLQADVERALDAKFVLPVAVAVPRG